MSTTCSCGAPIAEADNLPAGERTPCPKCGGLARVFAVNVQEEVRSHASLWGAHKRPGFKTSNGRKRPVAEFFEGWDIRRSVGDLVRKSRLIDREQGRYREYVETEDGTVLRDVDEPLQKHQGHGSDKPTQK